MISLSIVKVNLMSEVDRVGDKPNDLTGSAFFFFFCKCMNQRTFTSIA